MTTCVYYYLQEVLLFPAMKPDDNKSKALTGEDDPKAQDNAVV